MVNHLAGLQVSPAVSLLANPLVSLQWLLRANLQVSLPADPVVNPQVYQLRFPPASLLARHPGNLLLDLLAPLQDSPRAFPQVNLLGSHLVGLRVNQVVNLQDSQQVSPQVDQLVNLPVSLLLCHQVSHPGDRRVNLQESLAVNPRRVLRSLQ